MPQPKSPPLLGWYLGNRNYLREMYGCTKSCTLQEFLIDMDVLEAAPYKNSLQMNALEVAKL